MFQLTFPGTGAAVPGAARGLAALLVEHDTCRFLVDRGEETPRQIRAAHAGIRRLAEKAGVGELVLTHQSDRYDPAEVLAEARERFPRVRIADDVDKVRVMPAR